MSDWQGWTPENTALLDDLVSQGWTTNRIAARLGCTARAAEGRARRAAKGIPVATRALKSTWGGWTPELVERLKVLVADGLSGGQIAAQFGCTRNVIIGKANRLDLKLGGAKLDARTKTAQSLASVHHRRAARANPRPPRPKAFPQPAPVVIGEPLLLRIFDPDFKGCRWPIDGEGDGTRFCCLPRHGGSYCPGHTLASQQPRTAAQKATAIKGALWVARRAA